MKASPLVCWLHDCSQGSTALVGGKCASLGELMRAGALVPPGFAVTVAGYRQFLAGSGAQHLLASHLEQLDYRDPQALDAASAEIRAHLESATFTAQLEDEIAEFYRRLAERCGDAAVAVAVRSSATAEDLPNASFAGQQDSFLWIRGAGQVLQYVRRCFASLFGARALAYRARMGFDHDKVAICVGVQKMVDSSAAGVMFTLNPSNGDPSTILINANFGFGESVVGGEVTPDEFMVNKVGLEILRRVVSRKQVYYTVDRESQVSRRFELAAELQEAPSLRDEEIVELAGIGKRLEQHYGYPLDLEWAVERGTAGATDVFILQARPETVWSNKARVPASPAGASPMDLILSTILAGQRLG